MRREKNYSTDDGNGMKVVAAIIMFSMMAFIGGMLIAYVGDTYMHPSFSAASPRSYSR
jgi:hypothetical protein